MGLTYGHDNDPKSFTSKCLDDHKFPFKLTLYVLLRALVVL